MSALQWIVKEAKAIKKKYPKRFAKWTDYVAQASAIYSSKHKGKSPVGKKKTAKKVAKKRISGPKDSSLVKKELAKKGLKMPHGYETIKRKRKISGVKKKKISEKGILSRIHKVKKDVDKLDEAQHKHMMNGFNKRAFDDYELLQKRISSTKFGIHTNLVASKMPANKQYKNTYIKTAERLKKYLKELETHSKELKKHI